MKETTGWIFTGVLAGVAMFSLATAHEPAPSMSDPIHPPRQHLASLDEGPLASPFSTQLAGAYFAIARAQGPADPDQKDWELRHQMTLKGFDAEQGVSLAPESPDNRALQKALIAPLKSAFSEVEKQRGINLDPAIQPNGEILALTAALQAQYDWWLLGAESGWDNTRIDQARARFEDTRDALAHARLRGSIAAL